MESLDRPASRPLAHIPPLSIFDPLEFDRSLPSSQYTLIKTDDLRIMYMEIGRVQTYLHNLINHGDDAPSLVIDDSKQAKPAAVERVPPEILSMIFEQVVPPDPSTWPDLQVVERGRDRHPESLVVTTFQLPLSNE
ncbi:hypothetical protein FIBSPDRAFT_967790 [Athelia psychrophila]|uniref:Uncharacterized protein n=1 Tax=Athelia psychrophila TaxID=1759441 RepID=A0A167VBM0_9AGAM|nr:hypothetical protein FIBSPDRAFT_967790 [Fibularhizoctonia sp. CBS 109695]